MQLAFCFLPKQKGSLIKHSHFSPFFIDLENAGIKAIITLGVLIVAAGFSFLLAKLVQYCKKKRIICDDESDISENTRDIIRSRLSIMKFRRPRIKKINTVGYVSRWISSVKAKRSEQVENNMVSEKQPQNGIPMVVQSVKSNVVQNSKVSEVPTGNTKVVQNGKIKAVPNGKDTVVVNAKGNDTRDAVQGNGEVVTRNSSPGLPRMSCFSSSNVTGGASKPPEELRTVSSSVVTSKNDPSPRSRTVSSKNTPQKKSKVKDKEVNSVQKVQNKAVHFKETSQVGNNFNIDNSEKSVKNNNKDTLDGVTNASALNRERTQRSFSQQDLSKSKSKSKSNEALAT